MALSEFILRFRPLFSSEQALDPMPDFGSLLLGQPARNIGMIARDQVVAAVTVATPYSFRRRRPTFASG